MALLNLQGMPDLQLRMSKKVAQLTKVITQLNDKNEDSELDFQEVAEQYEAEIEKILRETADRVNCFKNKLETARDEKRILEIQQRLEAKYEEENRKLATELDNVRKRAADKEAAIQKAATKQIDGLSQQVEQLQAKLQQCMREKEAMSKDTKSKELQEELLKARLEAEAALAAASKHAADMLAERKASEDVMQARLDKLSLQLEIEGCGRRAAEQCVVEQRAQWEQERRELQEGFKAVDASWKVKIESMVEQLQDAKAAAKQAAGNEQRSKSRIEQLELSLTEASSEARLRTSELDSIRRELEALKAGGADAVKQLQQSVITYQEQVNALKESCSSQAMQLEAAQGEAARLASELQSCRGELELARKDLAQRGSQHEELGGVVQKLNARVVELEGSCRQAQLAGKSEAAAAAKQVREDMEAKIAAAEVQHRKVMESAQRDAASRYDVARTEAAARLAGAEKKLRAEMGEMKTRLDKERVDALAKQSKDHALQSQSYNQECTGLKLQLAELMQLLADERRRREGLDQEQVRLRGAADSQAKSASASRGQLEERVRALEAVEAALRAQLAALTSKLDEAARDKQGSAAAALALREELRCLTAAAGSLKQQAAADEQRAKEQLAQEQDRLGREWEARMAAKVKEALEERDKAFASELAASHSSLSAEGKRALGEVEARLRDEAARAVSAREAALHEAAKGAEAELQALRDQHAVELEAERKRAAEQLAAAEELLTCKEAEAAARLRASEDGLRGDMEAALLQQKRVYEEQLAGVRAGMRAAHEEEVAGVKKGAEQAAAELEARHREEAERLRRAAAEQAAAAASGRKEVEDQWRSSLEREVLRTTQAHEAALSGVLGRHKAELDAAYSRSGSKHAELQAQLSSLERSGAALQAELQSSRQRTEELQAVLSSRIAEMAASALRMKQEHADEKDKLEASFREEKRAVLEEHAAAVLELKGQVQRALDDAAARCMALEQSGDDARLRYDLRQPREQDALRIAQLEASLTEAEERARIAEDLMQQMRSELLLREDTYNKHFKNGGAGEKVLNVGSAINAEAGIKGWMLNRKSMDVATSGPGNGAGASVRQSVSRGTSRDLTPMSKK